MVILVSKVQIALGMTCGHEDQSINLLAHLNELRMHKKTKLKATAFNICDKCLKAVQFIKHKGHGEKYAKY